MADPLPLSPTGLDTRPTLPPRRRATRARISKSCIIVDFQRSVSVAMRLQAPL
jgi:hypothetical protein